MKTLAERVRHFRKKLDLTQKELAELAGVSQPTIADIERGDQLSTRKLPAIAKALKVTVGELDPDFKNQWSDVNAVNVEQTQAAAHFDLKALLQAVEGSYQMLGLSKEVASALLSLVLEVAETPPTPSAGEDFYRVQSEIEVRKFLKLKHLLGDGA
jgi:transcriptional regulator with XRE-family HTH domain